MKQPPSPSPPFSSESTGLRELVSPPRPHLVDRRLDASSCCRKLMPQESPPGDAYAGKENRSARKSKKSKAMSSKAILGERTVNLDHAGTDPDDLHVTGGKSVEITEDPAGISVQDGGIEATTGNQGGEEVDYSPISRTILDILEANSFDADPSPYDPVSHPFSPRPRFLRLKRGGGKAESPYHPGSNPLSPRPEFLRYNPATHREFIQKVHTGGQVGKTLVFPDLGGDDGRAQDLPGLKRSTSCPELAEELPNPPLEVQGEMQQLPKLSTIDKPVVVVRRKSSTLFRRALLLLVFLGFLATAMFVGRSHSAFFRNFGQDLVFRTREWTNPDVEDEVGYPGRWDIAVGVSNYSLLVLPEVVEEILLPFNEGDGDDVAEDNVQEDGDNAASSIYTEVLEMSELEYVEPITVVNAAEAENASAAWEDESNERCSRFMWEENIVRMCLEKTIFPQTEDEVYVPVATIGAAEDAQDEALLDFLASMNGDSVNDQAFWSTSTFLRQSSFHNALASLSLHLGTSAWTSRAAESLSLLGIAAAALIWLRKKQQQRRQHHQPGIAPASMPTSSPREEPLEPIETTTVNKDTGSGSTSTSYSSNNDENYGSFTTMESLDSGGEIRITPVRRSSRIRSRKTQSPMLKA